jgi:hypothetical protein
VARQLRMEQVGLLKIETLKAVKRVSRDVCKAPPNKRHKDRAKYTRKTKHKIRLKRADFSFID